MIAVVDYGVGNLYSLACSLRHVGTESVVTGDEQVIRAARRVILPGVGAFGDAAERLRARKLDRLLIEQAALGKPLLGICLGMQLLFDKSLEYGEHAGLGLLRGVIVPLSQRLEKGAKVPHMGWNSLDVRRPEDALGARQGEYVYYVHSYYATECEGVLVATSRYGADVPGIVRSRNVYGTQFHPEKSGEVGLRLLGAFARGESGC